jgi:WD40 repeat protein
MTRRFELPASYEFGVARDENRVAALGRKVSLIDLASMQRVASWRPFSHPSHADFSSDSARLAVKSTWGEVVVIATDDGATVARFRPRTQDEGCGILYAPDDGLLVDGSWNGSIRLRDARTLEVARQWHFPGEMITAVTASRDRQTWLFLHQPKLSNELPYLTVWKWPLEAGLRLTGINGVVDKVALSPDGLHIAIASRGTPRSPPELLLLSTEGDLRRHVPASEGLKAIRWSLDGKCLGIAAKLGFSILDVATLDTIGRFDANFASDLVFFDSGRRLLLGTWERGYAVELPGNA